MNFEPRSITANSTLLDALRIMDETGYRSLLVLNESMKFQGILSIGDIQRKLIKDNKLETLISTILRHNPRIARIGTPFDHIKEDMLKYRMEFIPVVGVDNEIENVYYWEDLFDKDFQIPVPQFDVPIVIMAGGIGSRMKPLTNVIPKPLIPYGEKTMLEDIFERFSHHGCDRFHISVNYKADLIEYYISSQKLPYKLHFFKEEQPLGTAGSLSLLKGHINETFFVSNCDILVDQDYSEILDYHRTNNNLITVVAALKSYPIPYGTIETGDEGKLLSITEKPELNFKINTGMYILEPQVLAEIPTQEFFHFTHLIDKIRKLNGSIGVFPISEKSWKDLGNWTEFMYHKDNIS